MNLKERIILQRFALKETSIFPVRFDFHDIGHFKEEKLRFLISGGSHPEND